MSPDACCWDWPRLGIIVTLGKSGPNEPHVIVEKITAVLLETQ
jgi:hypothetical protein